MVGAQGASGQRLGAAGKYRYVLEHKLTRQRW